MILSYSSKKIFSLFLICVSNLFIINFEVSGQSFESQMKEARGADTYQEDIENLLSLEPKFISAPKDTVGHLNYFITFRYFRLTDSKNVIQYATKAIDNYESIGYAGYRLPASYLMRGRAYQNFGMHKKANEDFDIVIGLPLSEKGFEFLCDAHLRKTQIFKNQGEFESAINYLNAFIESNQFDSIEVVWKANLYRELSMIYSAYSSQGKRKLAAEALAKADQVYTSKKSVTDKDLEQLVLNEMQNGLLDADQENYLLAIEHYQKCLALMKGHAIKRIFNPLQTVVLTNISYCQIESGSSCQDAKLSIDQADKVFQFHNYPRSLEIDIGILARKANVYKCQGDIANSKRMFADATFALIGDHSVNNVGGLRNYPNKKWLIEVVLIEEFINDVERHTQDQLSNLRKRTYQIDSLIDFHLRDMYFESSMQIAKDQYLEFYHAGIDIAVHLNDQNLYWFLTEKLNNLLLFMNIEREKEIEDRQELSNINSAIKELSENASQLDNEIFFIDSTTSEKVLDSLQQLLTKNKVQQLDLFKQRDVYLTSSMTQVNDLESIMSTLQKDETVIVYNFSRLQLMAMVVSQYGSRIVDLGQRDEIIRSLRSWHADASNPDDNSEALASFKKLSNELYTVLIKPLGDLSKKITIIPDAELYYLNFETLLSDEDQYLIYNHNISYELSGSLLIRNRESKNTPVSSLSAFIPNYTNSNLPELSNTNLGIKALNDLSGLRLFSDQETTKDNFITALKSSEVLHFGGHAIKVDENNKYSHLALEATDDKARNIISLGDLYSMKSSTQLVALPACHSGSGDLIAGEGISNLSRGFFYAGAKSVISSIWEANDKSSSTIMNSFYEYVLGGETKSSALRLAKLDYLKTAPEFLRHPNLWGGLTLTGDDRALVFNRNNHRIVFGILGLLVVAVVAYFFRFRSRREH